MTGSKRQRRAAQQAAEQMVGQASRRPVIAIAGPEQGGWAAAAFIALAVSLAGASPMRLRPSQKADVRPFDGLIVSGGADVDPRHYGLQDQGAVHRSSRPGALFFAPLRALLRSLRSDNQSPDPARDESEMALISSALDAQLPLLGICRGMQLINVVRGGTLLSELSGFYAETVQVRSLRPIKRVHLVEGTNLASILGTTTVVVNALHDQAVDRVGDEIRACGHEDNGIIQAIEATGQGWCVGVQWHPEYLPWSSAQRRLFRSLVNACRG